MSQERPKDDEDDVGTPAPEAEILGQDHPSTPPAGPHASVSGSGGDPGVMLASLRNAFIEQHPGWKQCLLGDEPVIALPEPLIDSLSEPYQPGKHVRPPFLNDEQAAAEWDLCDLCGKLQAIGLCGNRLVIHGLLTPTPPLEKAAFMDAFDTCGWSEHFRSAEGAWSDLQDVFAKADTTRQKLLAYAGWLVTNPLYVEELDQLKASFPCSEPSILFPLTHRHSVEEHGQSGETLPETHTVFLERLEQFLDRWCLASLAAWGLPMPQGPHLGFDGSPSMYGQLHTKGRFLFVPWHFRVQDKDVVLGQLYDEQKGQSDDRFMAGDRWPVEHVETYAQMFVVLHYRHTVLSRYKVPDGAVRSGQLNAAIADLIQPADDDADDHVDRSGAHRWIRELLKMADDRQQGRLPNKLRPR